MQSLPPAHYAYFERLRANLQAHYDPVQRRTLATAELGRRVQRSGEPVVEFGGDVLRLTREAHQSLQEEAIQAIATTRFLDGIADVDACRTVRLTSPATLNAAVTAAVTVEAAYQASPPAHKRPRIGQVSGDAMQQAADDADDAARIAAVRPAACGSSGSRGPDLEALRPR